MNRVGQTLLIIYLDRQTLLDSAIAENMRVRLCTVMCARCEREEPPALPHATPDPVTLLTRQQLVTCCSDAVRGWHWLKTA
jgi:hypothetical protein